MNDLQILDITLECHWHGRPPGGGKSRRSPPLGELKKKFFFPIWGHVCYFFSIYGALFATFFTLWGVFFTRQGPFCYFFHHGGSLFLGLSLSAKFLWAPMVTGCDKTPFMSNCKEIISPLQKFTH